MGKGAVGDLRQNVRDLLLFRECGNSPKSVRFPTNPVGCWQVYICIYTLWLVLRYWLSLCTPMFRLAVRFTIHGWRLLITLTAVRLVERNIYKQQELKRARGLLTLAESKRVRKPLRHAEHNDRVIDKVRWTCTHRERMSAVKGWRARGKAWILWRTTNVHEMTADTINRHVAYWLDAWQ